MHLWIAETFTLLQALRLLWARGLRVWAGGGQPEGLSTGCSYGPKDKGHSEGLVHKSTIWRTGLEPAFVAVPGDWFPPIPGGMTGVVYNDYTE